MNEIFDQINIRLKQIEPIIAKLREEVAKAPSGKLRIDWNNGHPRYYKRDKSQKKGKLIHKNERELIKKLAQRQYDEKILVQLTRERQVLMHFSTKIPRRPLPNFYETLHPARKSLITPHFISDESYAHEWLLVQYHTRSFDKNAATYIGPGNQHFRSKSEIIIAQLLTDAKIPFRYEYPFQTKDGRTLYPDFLCLNVHTREEIYWEHFGMMGKEEYASNVVKKLSAYSQNGLKLGKNLLYTMETESIPLDTSLVEKMILVYLK